jgi:hypothetical protein
VLLQDRPRGRQFLALRLVRCVGHNAPFSRDLVELGSIGDVLRAIGHLKAVELLAVNSHEFIVFTVAHVIWPIIKVLKGLELPNVNLVVRAWCFQLTASHQGVHRLHLTLLPHDHNLLDISLLGGLVHQGVGLVEMVLFVRGYVSFLFLAT